MIFEKINISSITSTSLKAGFYRNSLPEYYALSAFTENNLWHDHQNVFDHVLSVFSGLEILLRFENVTESQKGLLKKYFSETMGKRTRKEILTVATLLHDIAKTDTLVEYPDGTSGCPNHESIGADKVKRFSDRFDLNIKDEAYVERIVRHHGFISEILNLMIAKGNKDKYLALFRKTVGDVAIELNFLMHADLLGCDLKKSDKDGYNERINLLAWMLQKQIKDIK